MEYTSLKIAEYLNGKLEGNSSLIVSKIAKIDEADKDSITFLSNEIKNVIESRSCFVVKKKRSDIFPNDQLEDTQTPAQVKEKIDSTYPNIPVYFMGEIVPTKYVTVKVFVGYGEYECDDGNKILNQQKSQKLPELKCERPIYKYETREIVSCYKL